MSIADWIIFAYVNIIAIMLYHRIIANEEDVGDYYEDEDGFTTSLQRGDLVKPDDNGILAEFKDSDGKRYVAILVDKKEYLRFLKGQGEKEEESNENQET